MNNTLKAQTLSPAELNTWIAKKEPFLLINVLPEDYCNKIHVPESKNACVFQVNFLDQVAALTAEKNTKIVLYGSSAHTYDAVTAAEKLARASYQDVWILQGGLEAWKAAGYPLQGTESNLLCNPQTKLQLVDHTYKIDTEKSVLIWYGRNANSTHYGTVGLAKGELSVYTGDISGNFTVNMESIEDINLAGDQLQPVLEHHLKSDDFFFTELFPTARFTIKEAKPLVEPYLTSPNYEIKGILELRGIQAPLSFLATVSATPENQLRVEAHFDLDRTKWGVIYGSARFFEHLGMHAVYDLLSFQMRLVAI